MQLKVIIHWVKIYLAILFNSIIFYSIYRYQSNLMNYKIITKKCIVIVFGYCRDRLTFHWKYWLFSFHQSKKKIKEKNREKIRLFKNGFLWVKENETAPRKKS
jgi:hypothetical protein